MHMELLKSIFISFSKPIVLLSPERKPHSLEKSSLPESALQTMKNLYGSIPRQASTLTVHCPFIAV